MKASGCTKHRCECKHTKVKFCPSCQVVHCQDCQMEWTARSSYTWYSGYSQPRTWTGDQIFLGNTTQTVSHDATKGYQITCSHKDEA